MIKLFTSASIKSIDKKEGIYEVMISSGEVDRMGDTINPNGWYLKNYKKNPVILWSHSSGGMFGTALPPVGRAERTWVKDGKELWQKQVFASTEFAQELKLLVDEKCLSAQSVGFLPLVEDEKKGDIDIEGKMYRRVLDKELKAYTEKGFVEINGKTYSRDGEHFEKQELLEVSWVDVPALPSALVLAKKMNLGLVTKALEQEIKENPEKEEKEIKEEPGSEKKETENKKETEKETYDCECLDCGHKMTSEKHCADIKCPECGGEMRRAGRPGAGKELTTDQFNKVREFISETEKAISILKGILPETEATPADDNKGREAEKKIKSQLKTKDKEAEIRLLRLADKAIEALLRKLRQ